MNELRDLKKIAKKHGYTVELNGRGHWVFRDPEGRRVATCAATASDHRHHKNTAARLRAAGLPIPHKGGRKPRERKP